ncbi:MAG: HU family DNA-binding protein [Phocaeicola sp.]
MAKNVNYSVTGRKNPQDKNEPMRYYAQVQASGYVTVSEMAKRIQKSCTVTKADTLAVLAALEDVILEALGAGEIVRLAELGSFQVGVSGQGAATEAGYSPALITKRRINFRPSKLLMNAVNDFTFTRVEKRATKQKTEQAPSE